MSEYAPSASPLSVQSNKVLLAKQQFSLYEKRILLRILETFAYQLRQNLDDVRKGKELTYQVDLFDSTSTIIYKLSDLESDRNYNRVKKALKDLNLRYLEYSKIEIDDNGDEDEVEVLTTFLQSAKIHKTTSHVVVQVDKYFYSKLLDLSQGYTKMSIASALTFKSIYTIRIYELIAKWRNKPKFSILLDEYRRFTNTEDKFIRTPDLIKKTIDVAKRELDNSGETDLKFNYELIKSGRTIIGFDIYVLKTSNSFEFQKQEKEEYSPRWDLPSEVIEFLKDKVKVNLRGKSLEIVKQYSANYKSKEALVSSLNQIIDKGNTVGVKEGDFAKWIIGCMKQEVELRSQFK